MYAKNIHIISYFKFHIPWFTKIKYYLNERDINDIYHCIIKTKRLILYNQ